MKNDLQFGEKYETVVTGFCGSGVPEPFFAVGLDTDPLRFQRRNETPHNNSEPVFLCRVSPSCEGRRQDKRVPRLNGPSGRQCGFRSRAVGCRELAALNLTRNMTRHDSGIAESLVPYVETVGLSRR